MVYPSKAGPCFDGSAPLPALPRVAAASHPSPTPREPVRGCASPFEDPTSMPRVAGRKVSGIPGLKTNSV